MTEEEKEEMEFECKPKIIIYKEVEERINWFTHNYLEEVSGWLIGEVKDGLIHVKEIIFPFQEVSGGTVDTTGGDLVKLRKEYGDKCLEIIGHWHSHNLMNTFWSGTDEEFMEEHSEQREFSLFMVSGKEKRHRIKIMLNKPFKINIDNLDYQVWESNPELTKELQEVIKIKVKEKVYVTPKKPTFYPSSYPNSQQRGVYDYGRGVYDYGRGEWYDTPDIKNKDSELNSDDEIEERANNCINFNPDNFTINVRDIDENSCNVLRRETKGRNPTIHEDNELFILEYKSKTKEKAIILVRQIKEVLVDIFTEEFFKFGDLDRGSKEENDLEVKIDEEDLIE